MGQRMWLWFLLSPVRFKCCCQMVDWTVLNVAPLVSRSNVKMCGGSSTLCAQAARRTKLHHISRRGTPAWELGTHCGLLALFHSLFVNKHTFSIQNVLHLCHPSTNPDNNTCGPSSNVQFESLLHNITDIMFHVIPLVEELVCF